jgi:hypothetical protein
MTNMPRPHGDEAQQAPLMTARGACGWQVAQAKNVDLLNQMHQLRLENEKTQAALTDSHALETRAAFVTVRQVLLCGSPAARSS